MIGELYISAYSRPIWVPTRKAINILIYEKFVTENSYETQRRVCGGAACQDYPVMAEYTQSKYERRSWVGVELLKMKKLAHERLWSSRGKIVSSQSPIEKEAVIGKLKHIWGFRRFMKNECLSLSLQTDIKPPRRKLPEDYRFMETWKSMILEIFLCP